MAQGATVYGGLLIQTQREVCSQNRQLKIVCNTLNKIWQTSQSSALQISQCQGSELTHSVTQWAPCHACPYLPQKRVEGWVSQAAAGVPISNELRNALGRSWENTLLRGVTARDRTQHFLALDSFCCRTSWLTDTARAVSSEMAAV